MISNRYAIAIDDDPDVEYAVLELPVKPNIDEYLNLMVKGELRRYRITEIYYHAKLDYAFDPPFGRSDFVDVRAIRDEDDDS